MTRTGHLSGDNSRHRMPTCTAINQIVRDGHGHPHPVTLGAQTIEHRVMAIGTSSDGNDSHCWQTQIIEYSVMAIGTPPQWAGSPLLNSLVGSPDHAQPIRHTPRLCLKFHPLALVLCEFWTFLRALDAFVQPGNH